MKIKGRKNDSLWSLSQLFDVPFALLLASNPTIKAYQSLYQEDIQIPGYLIKQHEMKENETINTVLERFDVKIEPLQLVNEGDNFTNLKSGDYINIPIFMKEPIVNGRQNYSYEVMVNDLRLLEEIYPFLKKKVIGHSVQKKAIPEIVIGDGQKKIHMNGSFHANEWITTAILMTLLNDYLLSLTNRSLFAGVETLALFHSTTLSLVPMVNPDGVDLVVNGLPREAMIQEKVLKLNNGSYDFSNWKANLNGVDLNNQFPAKWELEKPRKPEAPSPRDYPGEKPLTEPEAIAMAELTRKSNFDRVIAFHTQCKEIYWGFDNREPQYSEVIVKEFEKQTGYIPIRNIDSYAGFKDWFIYKWRKPGFTVELGEGVNPLPISQFPDIYQESVKLFLASLYM